MGQPPVVATFPDFEPTLPQLLHEAAKRWGDSDCVVTPDERITYRELEERSRRMAASLISAGVSKGSHVGVLLPNGVDWVVTWAAAARLGAVVVPVNTFYQTAELQAFLAHSEVQLVVGVSRFLRHDYLSRFEAASPELVDHVAGPLLLNSLPHLRRVILLGGAKRAWASELDDGASHEWLVGAIEDTIRPGDEMFITYTSGSTGEPKGVVHSHGGLLRHSRNLAALSSIDETCRAWTSMPLCWVGGFVFTLLRVMAVGGCFVTQESFEPELALQLLERERVTHVSAWPAVVKSLSQHPAFPKTDLSSVRNATFYEALPADRRPLDPGLVVGSLGMSETAGPHTFWLPGEDITGAPEEYRGTFGHEVPGTEHRIIDPETGEVLPEGVEGEVLVRGYSLMLGYYRKEQSEVFDSDGWFHTGDRGYFRDGWFFFTGRQSDLIKTSGANVAPGEVEAQLMQAPAVKLAFVVGVPNEERGEDVVAMIVLWEPVSSEEADRVVDEVKDHLRSRVSSYKVPRHAFLIGDEDVPWLISQKVDRRAIGELARKLVAGVDDA